jgi:hypothetical protein
MLIEKYCRVEEDALDMELYLSVLKLVLGSL